MNIFSKKSVRKVNVYNIFTIFVPKQLLCSCDTTYTCLQNNNLCITPRYWQRSAGLRYALPAAALRLLPNRRAFRPPYPLPEQA